MLLLVAFQKPSEVWERLLEKAGYRCEYVGPDGKRCSARTNLQIEHTRPFAVYQDNAEKGLRVYCRTHNHFAAEEFFGRECIEQKIKEQRQEKVKRSEVKRSEVK